MAGKSKVNKGGSRADEDKKKILHEATGLICLVGHFEYNGKTRPSCWKCSCGEWVEGNKLYCPKDKEETK